MFRDGHSQGRNRLVSEGLATIRLALSVYLPLFSLDGGLFFGSAYLPSDAVDAIIIDCSNVHVADCLLAIRE